MKTLAPPEERKIGLKNNTSCVSPAPIQHFSLTWPLSVLAGYPPVIASWHSTSSLPVNRPVHHLPLLMEALVSLLNNASRIFGGKGKRISA